MNKFYFCDKKNPGRFLNNKIQTTFTQCLSYTLLITEKNLNIIQIFLWFVLCKHKHVIECYIKQCCHYDILGLVTQYQHRTF